MTASCPGFATYRMLANDQVEVNGRIPTWAEGSHQEELLLEVWNRYSGTVSAASREYDIPAPWILGIITAESAGDPQACSPCAACRAELCESALGFRCCAFGVMQMIGIVAREYGVTTEQLMSNPSVAIDAGTRLLSDLVGHVGFDLPRVSASYNGGRGVLSKCGKEGTTFGWRTNHDYPMKVVRYSNTAIALGLKSSSVGPAVMVAAAGIGVAFAIHRGLI